MRSLACQLDSSTFKQVLQFLHTCCNHLAGIGTAKHSFRRKSDLATRPAVHHRKASSDTVAHTEGGHPLRQPTGRSPCPLPQRLLLLFGLAANTAYDFTVCSGTISQRGSRSAQNRHMCSCTNTHLQPLHRRLVNEQPKGRWRPNHQQFA